MDATAPGALSTPAAAAVSAFAMAPRLITNRGIPNFKDPVRVLLFKRRFGSDMAELVSNAVRVSSWSQAGHHKYNTPEDIDNELHELLYYGFDFRSQNDDYPNLISYITSGGANPSGSFTGIDHIYDMVSKVGYSLHDMDAYLAAPQYREMDSTGIYGEGEAALRSAARRLLREHVRTSVLWEGDLFQLKSFYEALDEL